MMTEENKNRSMEKREEIEPALKQFIDDAIVPILVQEYLKEMRPQQTSKPDSKLTSTAPKNGKT